MTGTNASRPAALRLEQAPELRHQPGEPEYTPELYAVLKRLRQSPGTPPHLIQEWYDLQSKHLRQIPIKERNTHALVLTPRATLGGLELMVYPAGLGIMVVSALTLAVGQVPLGLCIAAGLLIGSLSMLLINRASAAAHRKAHARLGMDAPPDYDTGINV